jgi:hypothetical protein
MTSQSLALRLPEIVEEVLQQLRGDQATLHSAIRVSRTWFDRGIGLLWYDVSVHSLQRIAPARIQFYAHKIVRLSVHEDALPDSFPTTPAPRIQALYIDMNPSIVLFANALQYNQPSLQRAELRVRGQRGGACCGRSVAPTGSDDCISFGGHGYGPVPSIDAFVEWLMQQARPMLAAFRLRRFRLGSQQLMDRLVCYIAQQGQLKRLELDNVWPEARRVTVEQIALLAVNRKDGELSRASLPYARLRDKSLTLDHAAMPALAHLLPSLTSLEVLSPEAHGVITIVASLTTLQKLGLRFGYRAVVGRDALQALCSLRRLHSFLLISGDVQGVTESDLLHLLWPWSTHESLTLTVLLSHSPELLGRIGATCPNLTELEIGGEHCLDCALVVARHPTDPFPKLTSVIVGVEGSALAPLFGRVLFFSFPLLVYSSCSNQVVLPWEFPLPSTICFTGHSIQ